MEDMGMTDNQWKDNLRVQLENWEDVEELLNSDKKDEALKETERVKERIRTTTNRKRKVRWGKSWRDVLLHRSIRK